MPRALPDPQTRINVKVNAADWAWMLQHRPGQANKVIRAMLHAWVEREQFRDKVQQQREG